MGVSPSAKLSPFSRRFFIPHFVTVDAETLRHHVEMRFVGERDLRAAEAAKRAGGNRIGINRISIGKSAEFDTARARDSRLFR